ncbi:MAG: histidine phosphotransferase family protein [Roseococcus sp.]|nr:histidine phosphotransferase family protein [Roseococcus sp.]
MSSASATLLDPRLAELVAARVCHDLGSPVASLGALLPQAADPAAQEILRETAQELRARLQLLAALFGPADERDWAEIARLLTGAPMAHRVAFAVPARAGALPAARSRLVLAALLLAAEALPRGGSVHATEPAPGRIAVRAEGRQVAWSESLLRLLAGEPAQAALELGPRHVLAPWLFCLAAEGGEALDLAWPPGGGAPVLFIGQGD